MARHVPSLYNKAELITRVEGVTLATKVRDIIKEVEADGWVFIRMRGSHRIYKHPNKPGHVTIPGHLGDDVRTGTLDNIRKQAGLK